MSFEQWDEAFQARLTQLAPEGDALDDKAWAQVVSDALFHATKAEIVSKVPANADWSHRLHAMESLIEIASSVAFTPPTVASDLIRKSKVPTYLMDSMFSILVTMAREDLAYFKGSKGKALAVKAREIRQVTLECWGDNTWDTLDDVLRLLRELSGPVGYLRGCEAILKMIQDHSNVSRGEDYIIRFMRYEVTALVTRDACFETKRNALNALAYIGFISFEVRPLPEAIWRPLYANMESICRALTKGDVASLIEEVPTVGGIAFEDFMRDFSASGSQMQMLITALIEMDAFRHVDYSTFSRDLTGGPRDHGDLFSLLNSRLSLERPFHKPNTRGLLLKLLYLRWTKRTLTFENRDTRPLDKVLRHFINKPVDLTSGVGAVPATITYHPAVIIVTSNFPSTSPILFKSLPSQEIARLRQVLSSSVTQVMQDKSGATTYEARVHLLKSLGMIAVRFCACMQISDVTSSSDPYNNIFKDAGRNSS